MGRTLKSNQELVNALNTIESGLNDWELEFIDSITKQVEQSGFLTDRQFNKAEDLANGHNV